MVATASPWFTKAQFCVVNCHKSLVTWEPFAFRKKMILQLNYRNAMYYYMAATVWFDHEKNI